MKLVRYSLARGLEARLGALLELPQGSHVVDLRRACALAMAKDDPFAEQIAAVRVPDDMIRFLEGGDLSMKAAKTGLDHVRVLTTGGGGQALFAGGILAKADAVRLMAPIARPRKIISVGGNYRSHIEEVTASGVSLVLPKYPIAFLKMPSAVVGPDEDVLRSRHTEELDYELELALVVGKRCKDVPAQNWRDVIAGITIVNDVSMRDIILTEIPSGIPFQGKNLDTACPLGPCIATLDEMGDIGNLDLCLRVNGEVRQHDNTRNMLHDIGSIVAYWSRVTLEPGDIITTGTMGGVAGFHKLHAERLLKPGDRIEAEIQNVGILRNRVVDEIGRTA